MAGAVGHRTGLTQGTAGTKNVDPKDKEWAGW
jgi:hypothetical protein